MSSVKKKQRLGRRAKSSVNYGGRSPVNNKYANEGRTSQSIDVRSNIKPKNAKRNSRKFKKGMIKIDDSISELNKEDCDVSEEEHKNNRKIRSKSINSRNTQKRKILLQSRPFTPEPGMALHSKHFAKKKSRKKKKQRRNKTVDSLPYPNPNQKKQNRFSQEIFNQYAIQNNNDNDAKRMTEFDLFKYSSRNGITTLFKILKDELNKQEQMLLDKVTMDIDDDDVSMEVDNNNNTENEKSDKSDSNIRPDNDDYKSHDGDSIYDKLQNILSSDSSDLNAPTFTDLKKKRKKEKKKKKNKRKSKKNKNEDSKLYIDKEGAIKYIRNIGVQIGKTYDELMKNQEKQINKLKEILDYEKRSTKEREHVLELKKNQEYKKKIANKKKKYVERELRKVQPLVEQAQDALKQISRAEVDELRALRAPPTIAHVVLNCVIFVVYGRKPKKDEVWQDVRKLITFKTIKDIINFDTLSMVEDSGKKRVNYVIKKFLSNDQFTIERANNASKVLGPCIGWVEAQLKYASVLNEIKPMLDEIKQLQKKIKKSNNEIERTTFLSNQLQSEIKKCRGEMLEMIGYVKIGNRYYS